MEEVKFLLYSYLEDVNVGVIVKNDTLWLTQKSIAELFGVTWEKYDYFKNWNSRK